MGGDLPRALVQLMTNGVAAAKTAPRLLDGEAFRRSSGEEDNAEQPMKDATRNQRQASTPRPGGCTRAGSVPVAQPATCGISYRSVSVQGKVSAERPASLRSASW